MVVRSKDVLEKHIDYLFVHSTSMAQINFLIDNCVSSLLADFILTPLHD